MMRAAGSRARWVLATAFAFSALVGTMAVPQRSSAAPPPLRDLAATRGMLIGSAVTDAAVLGEADFAGTLSREYSVGTSENSMKWAAIHPAPDVYDFSVADAQVAFLEAHGMAVRGHNLAWWSGNPAWLDSGGYDSQQLKQLLRDHIATVMGHYRGRVFEWDVVNEAFIAAGAPSQSVWSTGIGFPQYVDEAFIAAREADPGAKLIYNDFGIDFPSAKFDEVFQLVAGMKQRGVPIDGVGFQAHLQGVSCGDACINQILTNMLRLNEIGLEVSITELDVAVSLPATAESLADQASMYRGILSACLLAPNCHTFVTWGFTDKYSWIPAFRPGYGAALPFDELYQPKPAYDALSATLANPPVGPACTGFTNQPDAQAALDSGVLGAPLLDPDGDGVACSGQAPSTSAPTPTATTGASGARAATVGGAVPRFTG